MKVFRNILLSKVFLEIRKWYRLDTIEYVIENGLKPSVEICFFRTELQFLILLINKGKLKTFLSLTKWKGPRYWTSNNYWLIKFWSFGNAQSLLFRFIHKNIINNTVFHWLQITFIRDYWTTQFTDVQSKVRRVCSWSGNPWLEWISSLSSFLSSVNWSW